MANTISNLATICAACLGAYLVLRERLPTRYFWGYVVSGAHSLFDIAVLLSQGLGIVGLGSFAFHATLLYSAQLADELPMILSSSWSCLILYDTEPTFVWTKRTYVLMATYVLSNTIFSIA
jgi:dihydroceramidase